MRYNKLISDSPLVSEIGLGAWQLGVNSGWRGMSENEAIKMVHYALESGVNFFDTSPNYGLGTSEERLGKALKGADRSKIVVNTKFGHQADGKLNYNASSIRESLEGSLKRLQLDHVDSYLIHNPPLEYLDGSKNEHYEILESLKDEGKIKAYGASLDTPKEMRLLMQTTQSEVIEAFYNILHQDTAKAFDMATKKEVGIIAKIPLDSGWLTGKYDEDSRFDDIRSRWSDEDIKTRLALVNKVENILQGEIPLTQAALLFCIAHDAVSTVIPGCTRLSQLRSNLESLNHSLTNVQIKELENFYRDEVEELNLPW